MDAGSVRAMQEVGCVYLSFLGGGQWAEPPVDDEMDILRERMSRALDPLYVGELVREGIQDNWRYIFQDNPFFWPSMTITKCYARWIAT